MAAWINKPKKKAKYQNAIENGDTKAKKRKLVYTSTIWKKLKKSQQINHPMCEICQMEGKIKLQEHIHHIISFLDVPDEEMLKYAYDSNNLMSVCADCHNRLHNGDLRNCKSKEQIEQYVKAHLKQKQSL